MLLHAKPAVGFWRIAVVLLGVVPEVGDSAMGNPVQLMSKSWFPLGLPALLIMVFHPAMLVSQSQMTTGVIEGTVYDQDRAVVPGTLIEFKHLGIGILRRVRTDDAGRYTAILLPIGNYEISARKTGFTTLKRTGFKLAVGETQQVDLLLKVSATATTIEITDAAPALELSRFEHSTLIDEIALSNLPLNGRRFMDLALLAPMTYQEKEPGH
ncbi:MAG: hypothetical protein DMG05_03325 [Acidobacteria bacterium]|nr:MAG: hypothetical protein DMG05_03325 [Acidobacteriota bacterium]